VRSMHRTISLVVRLGRLSCVGVFVLACKSGDARSSSKSAAPAGAAPSVAAHSAAAHSAAAPSSKATVGFSGASESGTQAWVGLRVYPAGTELALAKRVIVLLHGYGARGNDLVPLAQHINAGPNTAFLFPEAPISLAGDRRAWFTRNGSDFEQGYQKARALLDELSRRHPKLPIVVGGFSQGAILTANLLARAPAQVSAALILSPAETLPNVPGATAKRIPVFISHGRSDSVLPFEGAEALRDRLKELGYPVTWFPFDGRHTIGRAVIFALNDFLDESLRAK